MNLRQAILVLVLGLPVLALAQSPSPQTTAVIQGDVFEASGVIAVPNSSGALFVDDSRPRHVFWMSFGDKGAQKGTADPVALGMSAADLEDIASDGAWFYAVGSQSKRDGAGSYGLIRFAFDPKTHKASNVAGIPNLSGLLRRRVPGLADALRGSAGLLNIEGMTWDSSRLLLGLREPTVGANALVIGLKFPGGPRAAFDESVLEKAEVSVLQVPTGGLGIRGLGYDEQASRVLVLVGPSGERPGRAEPFRLLVWDPASSSPPVVRASFPPGLKPEGVTPITIGGRNRTLVVCDSGRFLFLD